MDRVVYTISSAGLVRSAGRSATWLFLPVIYAELYGLSFAAIGALIAAVVPVTVVGYLLGGALSDRWGRRWLSSLPSFLTAALLLVLFWEVANGLWLVVGLWSTLAFFQSLSTPAQSAMIGDVVPPGDLTLAYSVQRVFTNVGFAISPAVGGLLAGTVGLPYLFLFAGAATLGEGAILVAFLRETRPRAASAEPSRRFEGFVAPFADRRFVPVLTVLFGLIVVANQFSTPLTLYLSEVRVQTLVAIGLLYAVNGFLVVALQIPLSLLMRRALRPLVWMGWGATLYGLGFLGFGIGSTFGVFAVAMAVLTVGENLTSPVQQTLVARFGGPARRGSYFGAYNATANAARAVGPVAGTVLLSFGPSLLWGTVVALSLLVALGFFRLDRQERASLPPDGALSSASSAL